MSFKPISQTLLDTGTVEVTVNSDLSSAWTITGEGETPEKWSCKLDVNNVYTTLPWENEDEVKNMEKDLRSNPNFWKPYKTAAEQKVIDTPFEATMVREKRGQLLDKYEWTVNSPDLTDDKKAEWKTYRQALRDLPDQSGFPWEADGMTWPTKPTS